MKPRVGSIFLKSVEEWCEAASINDMWKIVNSILTPRESAKLIIQVKGPIKGKYEDPELVSNELNNWFKEKWKV